MVIENQSHVIVFIFIFINALSPFHFIVKIDYKIKLLSSKSRSPIESVALKELIVILSSPFID